MIHRVDNRSPDYELFIQNLIHNLRRSGVVICGRCRSETPVWNTVLCRDHVYHCETCATHANLMSQFRKDPRWRLSIPFSCSREAETFFGFTSDLSQHGLGLSHPHLQTSPDETLTISLFADRRINFEAIVRYANDHDLGHRIGLVFEGGVENQVKVAALLSHFGHQLD